MRSIGLALAAAVVIALVIGWILRRRRSAWGARVSVAAGIAARALAAVFLAVEAVNAGERGGPWFVALAIVLGVIALGGFAIAGFLAWGFFEGWDALEE